MDHEIELISDGDGLAIVGKPGAVERFMAATGLAKLESQPLALALSAGASAAQVGAQAATESGRWLKLTADSAEKLKKFPLTPTDRQGVSHAMLGERGAIKSWLQVESSVGAQLANPALLSGAAGMMAQMAMQQSMAEITAYLVKIDQKLDDVLRAQTNQVLARLDGVHFAVREAMSVKAATGRVSEVTWSKVQNSAQTIHETQGYALRQLADIAEKLEAKAKINDLFDVAEQAGAEIQKWLMVLARCYELHDAVGVLELDRVLDASPDELDRHRIGLQSARRDRVALISERTEHLLGRMEAAAERANSKVLFNPIQSPAVVKASNHVAAEVHQFLGVLGIESDPMSAEARAWSEAAGEGWEKVRGTGVAGLASAKTLGGETLGQARSVGGKLAGRVAERSGKLRRRGSTNDTDE